jgi:phage terminase large subunit-like protein
MAAKNYQAVAEQYIQDVLSGTQLVCIQVRQAIDRHQKDLGRSVTETDYPFYYDPEAGAKVCRLLAILIPSKMRSPIILQPWQVCMILMLYGWKRREDNTRRFRIGFIMLPRKTGKSFLLSGFLINALIGDDELGAEAYSAALVEEQARRVFNEAVWMAEKTPEISSMIKKVGDQPCRRLRVPETNAEARPLSRDKDSVQGTNPSFTAADELHVWKGRGVWDDIRYGMEARTQPLLLGITTAPAADDTTSICNTLLNHSLNVLNGTVTDDAFFTWITWLDPEDRWDDETKWIKACPNLGVTVKLSSMRQMALEAKAQPESLNAFKRYSLNMRVDAIDQAISTADWDACSRAPRFVTNLRISRLMREHSIITLKGRICFAALDLAIIDDTSALVLCFPPMRPGEKWRFLTYFWIPADNILTRVERDRVPYDLWEKEGFLIKTPGKTTDFDWIAGKILELNKYFDVRELIYDPALSSGLIKQVLTSGFKKDKVVKFAQTMLNYSAPSGDFVRTIARQELSHDADPVLRWHVTNLQWIKNHTGLFMPDKEKSIEKIDGAAACIMAYGRATHPDNAKLLKVKPQVITL